MSAAHNHPSTCCCEQRAADTAALGDTAWSDSRWTAIEPAPEVGDHGGFSLPVLAGAGVVVAVIFFIVRAWS